MSWQAYVAVFYLAMGFISLGINLAKEDNSAAAGTAIGLLLVGAIATGLQWG